MFGLFTAAEKKIQLLDGPPPKREAAMYSEEWQCSLLRQWCESTEAQLDDFSLTSDDLKQRIVAHQLDIGDYEAAKEAETKVRAINRLLKRITLNEPRSPEMSIEILSQQNYDRKQTFLVQSSL